MRRPKSFLFLGFFLLMAILLISFNLFFPSAIDQPKITFKETIKSFPKVKEGTKLRHEFVFTNTGNAPLIIKRVTTSCGCAAALASEDKIMPGKEGKIRVQFDTRGYSGQVTKQVYVESNDPVEPHKVLEIQAEIEVPPSPRIELNVYNYEAGLILAGDEVPVNIKVSNKGELDLQLELTHRAASFYSDNKKLSGPVKSCILAKARKLSSVCPPIIAREMLREYVLIKSNDPLRSTISLYISGYIITLEQLKDLFHKYRHLIDKERIVTSLKNWLSK